MRSFHLCAFLSVFFLLVESKGETEEGKLNTQLNANSKQQTKLGAVGRGSTRQKRQNKKGEGDGVGSHGLPFRPFIPFPRKSKRRRRVKDQWNGEDPKR